jgi:heme-degrading monooxygenase HmoA
MAGVPRPEDARGVKPTADTEEAAMFARVSRYTETADDLDEAARVSEEKLVPMVQQLPGFLGLQVLLDRDNRRSISITYWETREAMAASEEEANRIRQEGDELTGTKVVDVERYEVAFRTGL